MNRPAATGEANKVHEFATERVIPLIADWVDDSGHELSLPKFNDHPVYTLQIGEPGKSAGFLFPPECDDRGERNDSGIIGVRVTFSALGAIAFEQRTGQVINTQGDPDNEKLQTTEKRVPSFDTAASRGAKVPARDYRNNS